MFLLPTIEACSRLGRWLRVQTQSTVFPPRCPACRVSTEEGDLVCVSCASQLFTEGPDCPRCGAPGTPPPGARGCAQCSQYEFDFLSATTLGPYEGALRSQVLRVKDHGDEPLAAALGQALGRKVREQWSGGAPDRIVPVPKHWIHRLTGGARQERLLAAAVAAEWNAPIDENVVHVRRLMRKQSELTVRQRSRNARGAFATPRGLDLRGARVLLVDDVLTTGATASAIARALLKAGASRVDVAAVARGLSYGRGR